MAFCVWLVGFAETGHQLAGPDLSFDCNEYNILWGTCLRGSEHSVLQDEFGWCDTCLGLLLEVRDGESSVVTHKHERGIPKSKCG